MFAGTQGELEAAVTEITNDIREFNAEIMNEVSSLKVESQYFCVLS